MQTNGENYEVNGMSPYKRFYNDMYYARDAAGRLIALQNFYEATTDMKLSDSVARRIDFMCDDDEAEKWRLATERLTLFPLVELGPIMEATDSPDEIYDNYTFALALIKQLTRDDHDSKCIAEHSDGKTVCLASDQCPWRIAVMYCTDDAFEADFDGLEYKLDYNGRYNVVMSRLKALRGAGLMDTVRVEEVMAHYQNDFEKHFGVLHQSNSTPEDQR